MSLRIATFNVENLMNRFDYSGFRNQLHQDRTLALFAIQNEAEYRLLEQARTIAHADDMRQLTALAIAATRADILCLQEVEPDVLLFERGFDVRPEANGSLSLCANECATSLPRLRAGCSGRR